MGRGFKILAGVGVAMGTAIRGRVSGFCGFCAGAGLCALVRVAITTIKISRAKQLLFIRQIPFIPNTPCGDVGFRFADGE